VNAIFHFLPSAADAIAIHVDVNTRIQILESMSHLPRADKEQCGAFIVRPLVNLALYCADRSIFLRSVTNVY
jgi:hypothetical protein